MPLNVGENLPAFLQREYTPRDGEKPILSSISAKVGGGV